MKESIDMSTVIVEALVKNLTEGSVAFQYRKTDGSIRNAVGTLNGDLMPETESKKTVSTDGPSINYYDLESKAWRQFKRDNLITATA